jgi:hypothetical protein
MYTLTLQQTELKCFSIFYFLKNGLRGLFGGVIEKIWHFCYYLLFLFSNGIPLHFHPPFGETLFFPPHNITVNWMVIHCIYMTSQNKKIHSMPKFFDYTARLLPYYLSLFITPQDPANARDHV